MIVNVQFQSKYKPGTFGGRAYSYFTHMDLHPGDIVKLPTANGDGIGQVEEINVSPGRVDSRILPKLKVITEYAEVENHG